MISLRNEVRLPVPPDRIWQCFREMETLYPEWIPEHISWRWLSGEPLAPGSVWHADEWVGPMRIDTRFQVVESEPERLLSWRILGLPARLVGAAGSFSFRASAGGGCELSQEAHFGFKLPLFGQLVDLGLRLFLPIGEFRRHMRDEGDHLSELVGKLSARAES